MLGELLYEATAKITGRRVLDAEGLEVESSYTAQGKVKGINVTEMGTFVSTMREGGVLYGEDEAILMTADGDLASASPKGIGRFTGSGSISFRGCALYHAHATGKLAFLSNAVIVFEADIDASDNMTIKARNEISLNKNSFFN
jgi:hypothetical protein